MKSSPIKHDIADPKLYRTYFKLYLGDILYYLKHEPTQSNKEILHDFHKRILGYETIAGRSTEVVSRFLQEVAILWAEQGIFVRTSGKQPLGIQDKDLFDTVKVDGKEIRVWDLL